MHAATRDPAPSTRDVTFPYDPSAFSEMSEQRQMDTMVEEREPKHPTPKRQRSGQDGEERNVRTRREANEERHAER